MTREEAIKHLEDMKKGLFLWDMAELIDLCISALSENKGDLISRQAVLELLQMKYFGKDLYKAIYELPPVENKGKWERVSGGSFIDIYRCSKCKHEPPKKPLPDIKTWGWNFTDFCPNCGADLRGGKE